MQTDFVGELDMHRIRVGGRMDRDGRNAEFLGGAQNAQGDFAAIGDQDFVEHVPAPRVRDAQRFIRSPAAARHIRPAAPSSTRIAVTLPARGATISLNVFMASIEQQLVAGLHRAADFARRPWPRVSAADRRCRPSAISPCRDVRPVQPQRSPRPAPRRRPPRPGWGLRAERRPSAACGRRGCADRPG